MTTRDTITVGRLRFRVSPWQADAGVAHLSLPANGRGPSTEELSTVLAEVRGRGYRSAITSAIEEGDVGPFLRSGFEEHDRLHVLGHDLSGLDALPAPPAGVVLRRRRRGDRERAIDIDGAAFPPFWRLDDLGLSDAESATPSSRFRVAVLDRRAVGYAITGRGSRTGFLQRLATEPGHQRRGIGSALVVDSLRWCAHRRCDRVFVNTQVTNAAALALYRGLGFRGTGTDLVVLRWDAA